MVKWECPLSNLGRQFTIYQTTTRRMAMENEQQQLDENDKIIKEDIQKENQEEVSIALLKITKKVKRLEILNYVALLFIAALVIFNVLGGSLRANSEVIKATSSPQLPSNLSPAVADEMISKIKDYYNSKDNEKLYNQFGDLFKTKISSSDFEKQVDNIRNLVGSLNKATYSNYVFTEEDNVSKWFKLQYVAQYEKGTGNATVTIRVVDQSWQITGFNFQLTSIPK